MGERGERGEGQSSVESIELAVHHLTLRQGHSSQFAALTHITHSVASQRVSAVRAFEARNRSIASITATVTTTSGIDSIR